MATGKLCDYLDTEIRPRNPDLRVLGALVTQAGRRWRLLDVTRRRLELDRIDTFAADVPAAVAVAAAPRTGRPTFWLEPDGKVAYAYRAVASEITAKLDRVAA
jgi:cellulose biosynthesis protein BcsQ